MDEKLIMGLANTKSNMDQIEVNCNSKKSISDPKTLRTSKLLLWNISPQDCKVEVISLVGCELGSYQHSEKVESQ